MSTQCSCNSVLITTEYWRVRASICRWHCGSWSHLKMVSSCLTLSCLLWYRSICCLWQEYTHQCQKRNCRTTQPDLTPPYDHPMKKGKRAKIRSSYKLIKRVQVLEKYIIIQPERGDGSVQNWQSSILVWWEGSLEQLIDGSGFNIVADLSLVGFHESDLFWHVIGPSFVFLAHSRSLYFEQQQKITNIKTILIILGLIFIPLQCLFWCC